MAQNDNQRRAAQSVAAWLAAHHKNPAWLVDQTGADPGTVGDFLNGHRWPKLGTQGKIEAAIGWAPGTLRAVGNGDPAPDVTPVSEDAYVAAPGDVTTGTATLDDVMRAIQEMRRDLDELKRTQGQSGP